MSLCFGRLQTEGAGSRQNDNGHKKFPPEKTDLVGAHAELSL